MTMTKGIVAAALLVAGVTAASAQTVREPYTTGSAGYTDGSGAYGGPVEARSGRSLAPNFGFSNPKQGGVWSDPEESGGSAERNLNGSTGGSSKHPSSEEFTR